MVVFKKAAKLAATVAPTQAATCTADSDPTTTPLRYSDMTAGRKSTHSDSSPIKKLLDIFELCEQVLDHLSLEEALCATRVCRSLKANIDNSSILQAKLFLASDPTTKKLAVSPTGTLLSGPNAERCIATANADGDVKTSREVTFYTLHPLLKNGYVFERIKHRGMVERARSYVENFGWHGPGDKVLFNDQNVLRDSQNVPRGDQDPSSLCKMLLCQPPVREIRLDIRGVSPIRGGRRPGVEITQSVIRNEAGLTFGDLMRKVLEETSRRGHQVHISSMRFKAGVVVNAQAKCVAQEAGELSADDDPTQWIPVEKKRGPWKMSLKENGFAYCCSDAEEN